MNIWCKIPLKIVIFSCVVMTIVASSSGHFVRIGAQKWQLLILITCPVTLLLQQLHIYNYCGWICKNQPKIHFIA